MKIKHRGRKRSVISWTESHLAGGGGGGHSKKALNHADHGKNVGTTNVDRSSPSFTLLLNTLNSEILNPD